MLLRFVWLQMFEEFVLAVDPESTFRHERMSLQMLETLLRRVRRTATAAVRRYLWPHASRTRLIGLTRLRSFFDRITSP